MAKEKISDYLSTQSLNIPLLDVQIAEATLNAVLSMTHQKENTAELLSYFQGHEEEAGAVLSALYASLDSLAEKYLVESLAVYALVADEHTRKLIKVANFGEVQAQELTWDLDNHLAVRVARSAWALVIEDVSEWQKIEPTGFIQDERVLSQICLPVAAPAGEVLGVVYAESFEKEGFTLDHQAWLVALALSVSDILKTLPWHSLTIPLCES
jgi:putative methionine-R-sulfoxide reductase with GAF domain